MARTMTAAVEDALRASVYDPIGCMCAECHFKRELDAEREVSAKAIEACFVVKRFLERLEINTEGDDPLFELRARVHEPLHAALDRAIDARGAAL